MGVAVAEAQSNRAEQSETQSRSVRLTLPGVLNAAGFRVHEYRGASGCWAFGFGLIVFCLATGEWSIRRPDGTELCTGNSGPNELADALRAAQTGVGVELSNQHR
jgi:hypothetical protein